MSVSKTVNQSFLRVVDRPDSSSGLMSPNIVHGIRGMVLFVVLLSIITYQLFQREFINVSVWLPVYLALFPAFLANTWLMINYDRYVNKPFVNGSFFALDALVFALLIHFMGTQGTLFFLLFLFHIVLSSFIINRWAVFALAAWSSLLFSTTVLLDTDSTGQSFYINLIFNNVALFAVAGVSSIFSDQFSFLGERIRESKKEIEVLEDLNSLIVNNISSGLITLNSKLEIAKSNEAASRILEEKALDGRSLSAVFPQVFQVIQSGQIGEVKGATHRIEVAFEISDDKKLILETIIGPLVDSEGASKGYLILFQDLTDLKRMEKQIRQQDKLAAVGQLAAGIAHEIRNPLASISGSIQLLVANPDVLNDEDLKLMRIVLREIDRLNGLITEFLDFVRPDVQATEQVDVSHLMQEVLEMVRFNKGLPQDVEQEASFASQMTILGSKDKLKQAFLNIIINSYQAMDGSSEKTLKVQIFDEADMVKVIVEDSGSGMDEKTLERMFEPFLTTKPKGTGLGLAITHKVLDSHGATIDVTSEMGKGTRFSIEFPIGTGPLPKEEVNRKPALGTA